jgi:hypothetical protein
MEVETKIAEPREATPARQGATGTTPKLVVPFTMKEVVKLTGLGRPTLKWWIIRGWVRPISRSQGGRGRQHIFSAWQTVAIALLSAAVRSKREQNTYLGSCGVRLQMSALADLDDSLLLAESEQDMPVAERVAAEIARFPSIEDLSPQCLEGVAQVLEALDRKVWVLRNRIRTTRRVTGVD